MTDRSVLIIGGGAFGTSTAYHLASRGYKNITVLDRHPVPSLDSAANDYNKTIRYDYQDPLQFQLAQEAMGMWKDPNGLFPGLFRETGWIIAGESLTSDWVKKVSNVARKLEGDAAHFMSDEDIRSRWPMLKGDFSTWTSFWSPRAGWAPAAIALTKLAEAAQKFGAKYLTGSQGEVIDMLSEDRRCIGVRTADGIVHSADLIVLATGAFTGSLIDVDDELSAKSMCIASIQLTKDERERYSRMPMIDHFEQGMIFPPDDEGVLKLCSCRYVTNFAGGATSIGLSHSADKPQGIPRQISNELRTFLGGVIPELAERPWSTTRMCWDAATKDEKFRICHSQTFSNVILAAGGTLHGFKFLPNIGKYVSDLIEDRLDSELAELWCWRGNDSVSAVQSRHPYRSRDLSELAKESGGQALVFANTSGPVLTAHL